MNKIHLRFLSSYEKCGIHLEKKNKEKKDIHLLVDKFMGVLFSFFVFFLLVALLILRKIPHLQSTLWALINFGSSGMNGGR